MYFAIHITGTVNFYYVILYHVILFFCTPRKLFVFSFNKVVSTLVLLPFLLSRLADSLFEWQPCCATFLPKTARSGRVRVTRRRRCVDAAVAARCAADLPYSLYSLLLPCTTNGVVVLCARCRTCFGIVFSYAMTGGDFSLSTEPTKTTASCVPVTRTCVCVCAEEREKRKTHDKNYISK